MPAVNQQQAIRKPGPIKNMSQSYSRFQALRPEKSVTNYGVVSMRGLSKPSKVANPQDTDWINLKN